MYIVPACLRELHPPGARSCRPLPRGGRGRCWRCCLRQDDRIIAIIGIILLIGIVKKNAIMMIELRARGERWNEGARRTSDRHGTVLRFRRS
jgi:multidrug efflux pump subunit AcrB